MQKILVPKQFKNLLNSKIIQNGYRPAYLPDQKPQTILGHAFDLAGAILMNEPFTGKLMAQLPNLKVASRFGVGYDNVDLNYATQHGIWVTNTPGANAIAVAENTVADLLILSKHLYSTSKEMREGTGTGFATHPRRLLAGKTVGIVGFGHIARQVIKMLSGFNVRILIWNRHRRTSRYGTFVDWSRLFKQSDYVSLHIPATPQTYHCVNAKTFRIMKKSANLVNFGRGDLVNQADLVQALKTGEIAGAALDVFEKEPLPMTSQLRKLKNVFLTPHCAGATVESQTKMANTAADDVMRALNGQKPRYPVNQPKWIFENFSKKKDENFNFHPFYFEINFKFSQRL